MNIKSNEINKSISDLGTKNAFTINIKREIDNIDKKEAINNIKNIVKKYKGTIVKKTYSNQKAIGVDITQYIYINNPEKFFNKINITGNLLSQYDESLNTLSNIQNIDGKIGTIETLKNSSTYIITTLNALENSNKSLSGLYYVKLESEISQGEFVYELSKKLGTTVEIENINSITMPPMLAMLDLLPIIFLNILSVVIVLYTVFFRSKEIGIKKMLGFGDLSIGTGFMLDITKIYLASFVIGYMIIGIYYILNKSSTLLKLLIESISIAAFVFFATIIMLIAPLLLLKVITVAQTIKNKKPTKTIASINSVVKILFTYVLIGLLVLIYNLFVNLNNFYGKNYEKWEEAKNYAYVNLSYMEINPTEEQAHWEENQMKKLYKYVVDQGAIQIQTEKKPYNKEEEEKILNKLNEILSPEERAITEEANKNSPQNILKENNAISINLNYLKENPVYKMDGTLVNLEYRENTIYVLVPERLKAFENEIIKGYDSKYNFNPNPTEITNQIKQEISIIYIKNNQKYFTYNIEHFAQTNNYVIDPIVEITTEIFNSDISSNAGIYIEIDDPADPFGAIIDKVKELGLGAYYTEAYCVYDSVAGNIQLILTFMTKLTIMAAINIFTLFLLIIYTNLIKLEHNKMDNSIKMLNGYSFKDRHINKLLLSIGIYLIPVGIISIKASNYFKLELLSIVGLICLVDIVVTIITITITERKNLKDILKGN